MTVAPRTFTPALPIWCAGCGHFAVLNALQTVVHDLELPPHEVAVLAGIGCSGTIQNYLGSYGYHALHGRVLPTASGLALANPELTVIAAGGDGDGYAIGIGHLVHAFRRNLGLTYIVMSNARYGLTKGQPSPTSGVDYPSHVEAALDAVLLGLSIPASTFVARGYSGRYDQLVRLTRQAIEHARGKHGFAFLEVISPCVTYHDTYPSWEQALHDLDSEDGYDPADRAAAFSTITALAEQGQVPTGLIYQTTQAPARETPPAPAAATIEPARLRARYQQILDRYTVAAATAAPDRG